jgi:hypothetical protein
MLEVMALCLRTARIRRVSNQTAQNYDALVFGDVASPFAAF